jgi:hypothetical protein
MKTEEEASKGNRYEPGTTMGPGFPHNHKILPDIDESA